MIKIILFLYSNIFALCGASQLKLLTDSSSYDIVNYFHQHAESPDGSKLVYTKIFYQDTSLYGEVIVKDIHSQKEILIGKVEHVSRHQGAHPTWITNTTIAYSDVAKGDFFLTQIIDGVPKLIKKIDGLGTISDFSEVTNCIAIQSISKQNILLVDLKNFQVADLNLKNYFKTTFQFKQPYFSPDGKKLAFVSIQDKNLHTLNLETKTLTSFEKPKPIHQQWWSNDIFFAHDRADRKMKLYSLKGKALKTVAGYGNHGTVSFDRKWVATESFYDDDPIVLRLYRVGQVDEFETIFEQKATVRKKNFWSFAHMHPTFSRDGKKIFFNAWPSGKSYPGVYEYRLNETFLKKSLVDDADGFVDAIFFEGKSVSILFHKDLGAIEGLNFQIININGQVVKNLRLENVDTSALIFTLNFSDHLAEGIYFLSIWNDRYSFSKKLAIN